MDNSKLYAALIKAQSEFKTVTFDKVNPHFKSKFASLAALQTGTQQALHKNGLSIIQPWEHAANGDLIIYTKIIHESGESITSSCLVPRGTKTEQQMGSAISYARRYQYSSLLAVNGEEDDDAEATENRSNPPQEVAKKAEAPKTAPIAPRNTLQKDQVEFIKKMIADFPYLKEELLEYANKKLVQDIPQDQYDGALSFLKARIRQEGGAA